MAQSLDLAYLERLTRAAIAEARAEGRPVGRIIAEATDGAFELQRRKRARSSEIPRFFDTIAREARR
jgi:hypothetical protein